MSARFDPLRLLSEIQSDQAALGNTALSNKDDGHGSDADAGEDDFMSDKFLITTEEKQPLTYSDKRRRLEAHHARKATPKSLKQREEEARQTGLDRDLLAEAEIIAGGGKLPPEGKKGERRWDLLHNNTDASRAFTEGSGQRTSAPEDGTAKAMRMMLAMGYRRGEALGKRMTDPDHESAQEVEEEEEEEEEEEDDSQDMRRGAQGPPHDSDNKSLDTDEEQADAKDRDESQAREEDEYLAGGVATFASPAAHIGPHTTEPLRPDQRWLGLHRRAGIGLLPKTSPAIAEAIRATASSHDRSAGANQSQAELDFRSRISREHQERHNLDLLARARKTLVELDRSSTSANTQYSPLWLDSSLYHLLSGHIPSRLDAGTIDERMQKDAAFKEAVELLQLAFSSDDAEQVEEARTFCDLATLEQLELVLGSLRKQHHYCLFCGCQYQDEADLRASCPGEAEEDHD